MFRRSGRTSKGGWSWFRHNGFAITSYILFGVAGVLAFFVPSPSLQGQGGLLVLYGWGGACILGSCFGLCGVFRGIAVASLLGFSFCSVVSLVWFAALVLQTVKTGNVAALTAACLVGALTGQLAQRWSDVSRPPEE